MHSTAQSQRSAAHRSLVGIVRYYNSKEWLKISPYLFLLQKYFEDLLTPIGSNNGMKNNNSKNDLVLALPNNLDFKFHTKTGELLICLACEYWMDTATIVRSHTEYAKYSSSRNQNRTCMYFVCTLFFFILDLSFIFF